MFSIEPRNVLVVESDPSDAAWLRNCLQGSRLTLHVDVVGNGRQALDYLSGTGNYADARRPSLIVLDLNPPSVNGLDVLCAIHADADLVMTPVVALTSSDVAEKIHQVHHVAANCYLQKPNSQANLAIFLRSVTALLCAVETMDRGSPDKSASSYSPRGYLP